MNLLVADLIFAAARRRPDAPALRDGEETLAYAALAQRVRDAARGLSGLGLARGDRVAVYLEKRVEAVVAMFAAAAAGAAFVPVNPLLKPRQVAHILEDSGARILVTSPERLRALGAVPAACESLRWVVRTDRAPAPPDMTAPGPRIVDWDRFLETGNADSPVHRVVETDMAAILYTSGSTGQAKGVVLSHRNLIAGAESVVSYLENRPDDRLLCVLPFSFDYGLSQLTTAFAAGACAVLFNYLLPRDVIAAVAREGITGLACVPPLWVQLAELDWPDAARRSLRYLTNSGGHMPGPTLAALRARLPETRIYLMYGLTEAFRSTFLPPEEIDRRPDSIGKAIPNADVMVVREDGTPCAAGEPGELIHRGPLVAKGYWNDPPRTAERFRPPPGAGDGHALPEIAVWSGDTVRADEDGFLYFVGRRDEMIKSSGYRISPTEVEEVVYASGLVGEAVVIGVPHPVLGQGVVLVATPPAGGTLDEVGLRAACRRDLPAFMAPRAVVARDTLPRNANGKIDRRRLADELADLLRTEGTAAS